MPASNKSESDSNPDSDGLADLPAPLVSVQQQIRDLQAQNAALQRENALLQQQLADHRADATANTDAASAVRSDASSGTSTANAASTDPLLQDQSDAITWMLDLIPAIIYVRSTQLRFVRVNRYFEQTFGADRSAIIGKTNADLLPAKLAQMFDTSDHALLGDPSPTDSVVYDEVPLKNALGQWLDIALSRTRIRDSRGRVLGLVGIGLDITARKRAETEVARAHAQLRQQRDFMQGLIDLIPSGITVQDEQGRYTLINQTIVRWSGLQADQMLGQAADTLAALQLLPAPNVDTPQATAAPDKVSTDNRHFDGVLVDPTGLQRDVNVYRARLTNPEGKTTGDLTVMVDMSAHKRIERELLAAKQASDAASAAKGRFLANMSHEIRTPMNGIIGLSELALGTDLTAEQAELISTVHGSARSLLTVINDVLDLARVESGQLTTEVSEFDPSIPMRDVIRLLGSTAQAKGLELLMSFDPQWPDRPRIVSDQARFRQVLLNLVGNAIKFTERGSVALRAEALPNLLKLDVIDTGIGIAHDKLELIFEAFTQADPSITRRYGGTGLGLTICRQMMDLLGGSVTAHSEIGRGSTFSLWLPWPGNRYGLQPATQADRQVDRQIDVPAGDSPTSSRATVPLQSAMPELMPLPTPGARLVAAKRPGADQHAQAAAGSVDTASRGQPLDILVAEDNRVNQMLIRRLLEREGDQVTLVSNGLLAVQAAASHRFDLILMDMQMPEMDGLQATRLIRATDEHEQRAPVPIYALTAHALDNDREASLAAGVNGHLTKPVDIDLLRQTLNQHRARSSQNEPGTLVPGPGVTPCSDAQ